MFVCFSIRLCVRLSVNPFVSLFVCLSLYLHFCFGHQVNPHTLQWHALDRSEQARFYEMARRERALHMQVKWAGQCRVIIIANSSIRTTVYLMEHLPINIVERFYMFLEVTPLHLRCTQTGRRGLTTLLPGKRSGSETRTPSKVSCGVVFLELVKCEIILSLCYGEQTPGESFNFHRSRTDQK
jgi:hypothetical protein